MSPVSVTRRVLAPGAALAVLVLGLLTATTATPAAAADGDCVIGQTGCTGNPTVPPADNGSSSSGTQIERVSTPVRTCSVYANGAGMGSFCLTLGGGNRQQTLRERFGGQELQRCRYSEIPAGIQQPFNARPDEGRYMLMRCIGNINFDTTSGGRDRSLEISIVFVPFGTDIADRSNGITDFLWNQLENSTRMPVPVMQPQPNPTPLVGTPTFFTFQWVDPGTNEVIAQGPFADRAQGGPYRRVETNGFVMEARATSIRIDPNQEGIPAIECDPETPYVQGARPADQPADACSMIFPRSSASARALATKPIAPNVRDAFHADVEVRWSVTYGEDGGQMRPLGDGFVMRMKQVIPVQEVQAANQPPIVVF